MVAIIQYNDGNVQSVQYALHRLGVDAIITNDASIITSADKVIFPGVGHAAAAMECLQQLQLINLLTNLKQPVLGICLGMQLMCTYSNEGNTNCLGIFNQSVKLFNTNTLKVPHVGWNSITNYQSILFNNIPNNAFVYSVHSYYVSIGIHTIATTNYANTFSAALQKNNFYGVQFHPEKSGDIGEKILKNFISLA
jgi:imidazole glycerol-phosphate synthase subunit HisH